MIERPIIFSTRWINAILEHNKVQTRRPWSPRACPFGVPGDHLWVRECHRYEDDVVIYRADWPEDRGPWKSSRLMPRLACRIILGVREVAEMRLKDLTQQDAREEGVGSRAEYFACWDETYPQFSSANNLLIWACVFELLEVRTDVTCNVEDLIGDDELAERVAAVRSAKQTKQGSLSCDELDLVLPPVDCRRTRDRIAKKEEATR